MAVRPFDTAIPRDCTLIGESVVRGGGRRQLDGGLIDQPVEMNQLVAGGYRVRKTTKESRAGDGHRCSWHSRWGPDRIRLHGPRRMPGLQWAELLV